jgi:SAM-dependent methyltransferase
MQYNEYVSRKAWKPGESLQHWVSKRILEELIRVTDLEITACDVLEIGCGTGTLARKITERGFRSYSAFEPNSMLASMTRENVSGAKVLEVALPNVPSGFNSSYDLIIGVHVIEHAKNGYEAREWIASIKPLLKTNGLLVIISPEISDYKGFFWEIDWSHCFPTSKENLKQLAIDLEYEIVLARSFKLGSTRPPITFIAKILSLLIPTKMFNLLGNYFLGRPLGTGLKAALLWGATFVIVRK